MAVLTKVVKSFSFVLVIYGNVVTPRFLYNLWSDPTC